MHRPQRRDSDMCSMCPRDSFVDISMNKLSQTHLPNDGVGDPRPHLRPNTLIRLSGNARNWYTIQRPRS